jgi:hypothetical protein
VVRVTARELAEALNVRTETVCDLIRCMGIKPERQPRNRRAYALTAGQVKAISNRLRPAPPAEARSCSA